MKKSVPLEVDSKDSEKRYRTARKDLDKQIQKAVKISLGAGEKISQHGREYWSSVLFTKLLITSLSILRLMPSKTDKFSVRHWDFSAIASLSRDILEGYLQFYYLCVDELQGEEEWQVRQMLLQVKDARTRIKMVSEFDPEADVSEFNTALTELALKLNQYESFRSLPEKKKKELLKGDKSLFVQDDVLARMGEDRGFFRGFYRFLSNHVHTGPMSFYRMSDHGRGNGEENDIDKNYMAFSAMCVTGYLKLACRDMKTLHPDCISRGAQRLKTHKVNL